MDFQAMKMALICHILGMVHLPYLQTMVLFMDHQEIPLHMATKNTQVLVPLDPRDLQELQDPQVPREDVIPLQ